MCFLLPLPLGAVIVFPVHPGPCNTAILNCAHPVVVSPHTVCCLSIAPKPKQNFKLNLTFVLCKSSFNDFSFPQELGCH